MSEHTGFTRRQQTPEDVLETLRKKIIDYRYQGSYPIDSAELLAIIERLQKAEKKLKELQSETQQK